MMLLDEYSLIWKQIRPLVLMGLKLNYVNPVSLNWKESLQGCLITSWLLEWAHLGNSHVIWYIPKQPSASKPEGFRPIELTSLVPYCKTMEEVLVDLLTTTVASTLDPVQNLRVIEAQMTPRWPRESLKTTWMYWTYATICKDIVCWFQRSLQLNEGKHLIVNSGRP